MEENNQQLLELIKTNNDDTKSILYDMFSSALYGVVCKMVTSEQARDELLKIAFLTIFRNLHEYDPQKCRVFTWMLAITRKVCLDYKQKNSIQGPIASSTELVSLNGMSKNISELPDVYRQVIELSYFEGLTKQEIAERLSKKVHEIPPLISEATMMLRKIMKSNNG